MSQDFNQPADWIPFSEIKRPDVKVPQKHELDTDGINKKVSEYKGALLQANPGLDVDDTAVRSIVAEHHRELIQASRGVTEIRERGEQREREQQQAAEAKAAKVAAERQAIADAELDREKARRLWLWTAAGGHVDEFEKGWPEQRLDIIKERANALESGARSVAAAHYRNSF